MTPLLSSGLCLWEPLGPGAPGHERTFPLFIPLQRRSWHQPLGGLCSPRLSGAWEQPPATLLPHTPLCPVLSMPTFSGFQSSISAVPLTGGGTSGGLVLGFFLGELSGWTLGAVAGPLGVGHSDQRAWRSALPIWPSVSKKEHIFN